MSLRPLLVVSVQVLRLNVGKRKTCQSLFRTKNVCAKGQGPLLPSVYHGRHWHHSYDKCRPGLLSSCLHVVSNQKLWWCIAMMTWMLEPVLNEVATKGAFLSKVCPCTTVHAVMLSKNHQRSSTVQEEGLTIEGRHNLLLLYKQVHEKRGIAESQHAYINRARLTTCDVDLFSWEILQLL